MEETRKIKAVRGPRTVEKPYATWTHSERMALIQARIKHDFLFTSQNANMQTGWREVLADCKAKLGPDKTLLNCKKQWIGLMKKYKGFSKLNTGEGAGDEAPEEKINREEWPYYEIIHNYAKGKDNYHPPLLISSSNGIISAGVRANEEMENEEMENEELVTRSLPSQCVSPTPSTSSTYRPPSRTKLSEYDNYLKNRQKQDKKFEKKINNLLTVFGQMVKTDYPNVDVDCLLISSGSDSD